MSLRAIGPLALIFLFPITVFAAPININTADATLLDSLPGIGPSKAAAIIDYRTKNGPFMAIADIQKVKGIGPATFANLETLITIDVTVRSALAQPSLDTTSYKKVQTVEPITSTKTFDETHEEAVLAPAVATELAAAGAPLFPPEPITESSRAAGLFSVWTLGLLGVIIVAGGVFILL